MKCRGTTLIELVIVMTVTGIVAVMAGNMMYTAFTGSAQSQTTNELQQDAYLAIERLSRELREIKAKDITTMTATSLTFKTSKNETVTYVEYVGGDLSRGGNSLVSGLSNFSFVYYTGTGAIATTPATVRYIQMVMQYTVNGQTSPLLYSAVAVRNP